jgi:anti-sigma B factor antagonist
VSGVQNQFNVDVRRNGRTAVVAVSGELDLASGPELEEQLDRLTGPEIQLVVVDLRQLDFMDSTGLSIIVRAHQRLADEGCEVGLVKGSQQVQRLLDLTGVAERLRLVDTPEDLIDGT